VSVRSKGYIYKMFLWPAARAARTPALVFVPGGAQGNATQRRRPVPGDENL